MQQQVKRLETWLREQPGVYINAGLIFAYDDSRGVHWQAKTRIEPEQRLITIPHSICLSYLNALVDDDYPVFKQRRLSFTVEAIGFFYLMLQQINRKTSFWRAYLETLPGPDTLCTPLWYSDDDLAWLSNTDVADTMSKRKALYQQYYDDGTAILKSSGVDVSQFTWELFLWSITMFTSRSFSSSSLNTQDSKYWAAYKTGPNGNRQAVLLDLCHLPSADRDFSVLYPGIDAGNHDPNCEALWNFDQGRFSIAINQDIMIGQQICNTYGPKPNHELLQGYGFTIQDNPHDVVLLTLRPPASELQAVLKSTHAGYFNASGDWLPERATFGLRYAKPDAGDASAVFEQLPDALVELVVLTLRHEHGLGTDLTEFGSVNLHEIKWQRYLPHVARVLLQSLNEKLARLPSKQGDVPANAKQQYAKHYLDGQIKILRTYLTGFSAYLQAVREDASYALSQPVHLGRLEHFLQILQKEDPQAHCAFLDGVEANAQSADIAVLRSAGWEEDLWVLLISYLLVLENDTTLSHWASYLADDFTAFAQSKTGVESPSEQIDAMLELVQVAARVLPSSSWANPRLNAQAIGNGARIYRNESFVMATAAGEPDEMFVLYFLP